MPGFHARGALTALVTPFTADDAIDWGAWERLIQAQVEGGVAGLVPCGTTGEAPTLTDAEQRELVRRAVDVAKGRVPIVAGTGSFSTRKTIDASRAALEAGATAVMLVMPYYSKPSQDGLVRHVELCSRAIQAPIVLYNIPGRTGVDLGLEATLRILARCPSVVAIKDATGNVLRCQELVRAAGDRVAILSGDDALTVPMMSVGAVGVISVTANVYPKAVAECVADALAGRMADARTRHLRLLPVHAAMFLEPNPAPAKAALASRGAMSAAVRPPLVEASAGCRAQVAAALGAFEAA
jgi:4-hydroxy-tetrahydrodipicolinate synthase